LKSSPSECWKAWSRCTPGTSWGTGWLWQSCQDRCNCQQAETGKCESVPNTCPEVFEGSTIQQCHCYGTHGLPYNPINGEGVFTVNTFLCGPQARGRVRLSSKDPTSKLIIDPAYLDNDLDVAVLTESCRLCHEIIMKGRGTKDIIVGA
ncbi:unnamed protein product, partial [Rotaria sp. Silwood1]